MKTFSSILNKLVDWKDGQSKIESWKSAEKKIVFTNGCFDLLHQGHLDYLAKAKDLGDFLVIGLNSDNSVKRLKGPTRPINDEKSRAVMLAALGMIDLVVLFDEDTPMELIQALNPDVLVKGGDYTIATIVGADYVEKSGGRVEVIPFLDGFSTTKIVTRIQNLSKE